MDKISNIIDQLQAGIKAESLRQKAIASNVANIETPGYRRIDVRFEELLAEAIESGHLNDVMDIDPEFFQTMNTPVKSNGNDVSLENEVGQMVKNTLRHKAYIKLFRGRLSQIELAINTRA